MLYKRVYLAFHTYQTTTTYSFQCFWYYTLHFSWIYLRHCKVISLSQSLYTSSNETQTFHIPERLSMSPLQTNKIIKIPNLISVFITTKQKFMFAKAFTFLRGSLCLPYRQTRLSKFQTLYPFHNYQAKVSVRKGTVTVLPEYTSELKKCYVNSAHSPIETKQQCSNIHGKLDRRGEMNRRKKKRGRAGGLTLRPYLRWMQTGRGSKLQNGKRSRRSDRTRQRKESSRGKEGRETLTWEKGCAERRRRRRSSSRSRRSEQAFSLQRGDPKNFRVYI